MLSLVVCTFVLVGAPEAQSTPAAQAPEAMMVEGRVLEDGTQAPLAGAQVTLVRMLDGPPPAAPTMTRPPMATTDAQGRFRFAGVAPGRYRVTAQKAGFAVTLEAMMRGPQITVAAGTTVPPVDLTLQRGGVITGRVVDGDGEPVVNARVMAMRRRPELPPDAPPAAREAAARSANRLVGTGPGATTDDRGEFRLHSLAGGDYILQVVPIPPFGDPAGTAASPMAPVPTFHPGTTSLDDAQPVTIAAGQTLGDLTIRMATAAVFQVSGVVVDEAGAPVADAQVRLVPANLADVSMMMAMPGTTRTDTAGAFTLPQVRSGSYTLVAVAPVVIARDPAPAGGVTGGTTFVGPSGIVTGPFGNGVTIETRNGLTVRYREDEGTRAALMVEAQSVRGLRVVVKRPAPQQ